MVLKYRYLRNDDLSGKGCRCVHPSPTKVTILGTYSWFFFMAGEVGFVKFWQCSARCVFFMVRQVGLVKVRYGTFCFGRRG